MFSFDSEANLILVPEATLTRVKYWLNEYPIVLQNLHILNKQIINKQFYEKSKFDTDDFFNNSHTAISLFFETGPDKEDWFHKYVYFLISLFHLFLFQYLDYHLFYVKVKKKLNIRN
jgi:hypothetical protein